MEAAPSTMVVLPVVSSVTRMVLDRGGGGQLVFARAFLASGYRFEPDGVILNYFINDAESVPRYDNSLMERYSKAWAFFASRLDIAGRQVGFRSNRGWREYYEGLYDEAVNPGGWQGAEDLGLPYLDLLDAVRGEDPATLRMTVPDPHPNRKAHRLFGAAIHAWLRDNDLLDPPGTPAAIPAAAGATGMAGKVDGE